MNWICRRTSSGSVANEKRAYGRSMARLNHAPLFREVVQIEFHIFSLREQIAGGPVNCGSPQKQDDRPMFQIAGLQHFHFGDDTSRTTSSSSLSAGIFAIR